MSVQICEECGFRWDLPPGDAVVALRSFPRRYTAPLTRFLPDEDGASLLRAHPIAGTWSALEYAGHVAWAFRLWDERVARALIETDPIWAPADPDAAVRDEHMNEADPAVVAEQLTAAANALADRFDGVKGEQWARLGGRDGDLKSIQWMAAQTVHEGSHHLLDIGRVMRAARGR